MQNTYLIIWVKVLFQIWVRKRILHCHTLVGVKCQHLFKQVQSWVMDGKMKIQYIKMCALTLVESRHLKIS